MSWSVCSIFSSCFPSSFKKQPSKKRPKPSPPSVLDISLPPRSYSRASPPKQQRQRTPPHRSPSPSLPPPPPPDPPSAPPLLTINLDPPFDPPPSPNFPIALSQPHPSSPHPP